MRLGFAWWFGLLLASCAPEEPVVLQVSVSPPSVVLDPRDYRTRPAEGLFSIANDNAFEIFLTFQGFEGDHAELLTASFMEDLPVAAGNNAVVRVSYLPTASLWQDGSFTSELKLTVGFFTPGEDSGTGSAVARRASHPELWNEEEVRVTVNFSWDCDVDGDAQIADACGGPDCHDQNDRIGLDFEEICDRADNDCDSVIDEDPVDGTQWYRDADGDAWGSTSDVVYACRAPGEDRVSSAGDCNDADALVYPAAYEFCDEVDNDCDDDIDEGCE